MHNKSLPPSFFNGLSYVELGDVTKDARTVCLSLSCNLKFLPTRIFLIILILNFCFLSKW